MHHCKYKEGRWRASLTINAVGAVATGDVAIVVVVSKFTEGAWIPAVLIPAMVVGVPRRSTSTTRGSEPPWRSTPGYRRRGARTSSWCSSARCTGACIDAVSYAKSLAPERLIAVSVVTDAEEQDRLSKAWTDFEMPIELHTIVSPYRELTQPVLEYLDELDAESPDDIITVVIPEFVTQWKTQWLHNQSALALKARLLYRPNTVVTSVPVLIDGDDEGLVRH